VTCEILLPQNLHFVTSGILKCRILHSTDDDAKWTAYVAAWKGVQAWSDDFDRKNVVTQIDGVAAVNLKELRQQLLLSYAQERPVVWVYP
jgi:hypothetical protein